jgi:hypothetical protein
MGHIGLDPHPKSKQALRLKAKNVQDGPTIFFAFYGERVL